MPRIGLLSDTHGHVANARRAIHLFLSQGVDLILHMGDVGSTTVLDAMVVAPAGSSDPIEARVVFGNSDPDRDDLAAHARAIGIHVDDPVGIIPLETGELLYTHGDIESVINAAIDRDVRYICHGHTHKTTDQRLSRSRVINPGALFRTPRYTVAILDTPSDSLRVFPVTDGRI